MSVDLIRLIKNTAMKAFEASKPTDGIFGKVVSVDPIKIRINQKLTLTSEHIVDTQKLSQLLVGDKVVLLRLQGGQKYIVLDVIN